MEPFYLDLLDDTLPLGRRLRAALSHFGLDPDFIAAAPQWEIDHHLIPFDAQALERVEEALEPWAGRRLYSGESVVVDPAGVRTPVHELYWSEVILLSLARLMDSISRVHAVADQWGAIHQGLRVSGTSPVSKG
jgi:hypothetical protein